jgi:hypothetical protein
MTCLTDAWTAHAPELRGWLRRRVGNSALADDLLQDLFLKTLRQGERLCATHTRLTSPRQLGPPQWPAPHQQLIFLIAACAYSKRATGQFHTNFVFDGIFYALAPSSEMSVINQIEGPIITPRDGRDQVNFPQTFGKPKKFPRQVG